MIYKRMLFPRAFAVAIDDMGWMNGSHLGKDGGQGPSRAGVDRHFNVSDYQIVAEVSKATGVRLQGLFVMCEMDRENVCAKYPTTNMYGKEWNNAANKCDEQQEIFEFLKQNSASVEFGMHGVGHEYWPEKMQRVRAEWYNIAEKRPWPEETLNDHFKCFREIMKQYGLSEEEGHSFPESFVPCAYSFYWNPDDDYSLGKLLNHNGVKYANTDFSYIGELNPPKGNNGGGFDHGVHVLNRINYGNKYFEYGSLPAVPVGMQESDISESHFVNWLAGEKCRQSEITGEWIAFFKSVQSMEDRYLAKNTEQLHSQWLYKRFTKTEEPIAGEVIIDNSEMPDDAFKNCLLGNMVLKFRLDKDEHISSASLDNKQITSYFEEAGYAYIYLPPLAKKKYILKYAHGSQTMDEFIFNSGTYNIYRFESTDRAIVFDVKMYGTQMVLVKCRKPVSVYSSNPHLRIISEKYDRASGFLSLEISGRNIMGEKGTVDLAF
jgi:hypothetical protein